MSAPGRDNRQLDLPELADLVARHPHRVVFATVSGAHLYGFASVDSDVDLRGAHLLGLADLVGLRTGPETITSSWLEPTASGPLEVDLVTHDLTKFCRLLLSPNGYVLEQLLSPLVVATSPAHRRLCELAPACLTSRHAHHYEGFARRQWQLFETGASLKSLLYTFRVLLTGIHLMRAGRVEANLAVLAELVPEAPSYLGELIEAKSVAEYADSTQVAPPREVLAADVAALRAGLAQARDGSALPPRTDAADDLHDLLVEVRGGGTP